jgi:hypothetical protein
MLLLISVYCQKRLELNLHSSPSLTAIMLTIYAWLSLVFLGRIWKKFLSNSVLCNIPAISLHFGAFSQRRARAKLLIVSSYLSVCIEQIWISWWCFMKFCWRLLLRGLRHIPVLVNIRRQSHTDRDDVDALCSRPNITCQISFSRKIWFGKTFWRRVKHVQNTKGDTANSSILYCKSSICFYDQH